MQFWRLLDYSSKNSEVNLAVEEAILRCLLEYDGTNTIRFWQNPPSVIIGHFQDTKRVVDLVACEKLRVNVIRRISGGGAVYHDYGNINYSVFVKKESLEANLRAAVEDVEKSYTIFCRGVIEGLETLGIDSYSIKGNIMVKGKKVSGSAQHRLYNVILHHGTLMVDVNMEVLEQILRISNSERSLINLYEVLPNKVPSDMIKDALQNGFEKTFNIKLKRGSLTSNEKHTAKKLYRMKYSQTWWNIN